MADHIGFMQNAAFQTVGMAVVLGALGVLALAISLGARLLRPFVKETPQPAVVSAPVAAASTSDLDEARMHVAVVAAVAAVLPQAHRVVSVVQLDPNGNVPQWGQEGRRQIFQGRQVR